MKEQRRRQFNVTMPESDIAFVKENFGKKSIRQIASHLGINYSTLHNNLRVMGYVKSKEKHQIPNDCFNVDEFSKLYQY